MARFKFNKILGKAMLKDAGKAGGLVVTAAASRKFLDFNEIFKNQPPDSFLRKNQGIIKFLGGVVMSGMMKNEWMKIAGLGIAFDGGIMALRQFTTNKETQQSFFPALSGYQWGGQMSGYDWSGRLQGQGMGYQGNQGYYVQNGSPNYMQYANNYMHGQPADQNATVAGLRGPAYYPQPEYRVAGASPVGATAYGR